MSNGVPLAIVRRNVRHLEVSRKRCYHQHLIENCDVMCRLSLWGLYPVHFLEELFLELLLQLCQVKIDVA